ncbi:MAG: hypothetical protein ACRYG2_11605 [Janthinobacterium lividum]
MGQQRFASGLRLLGAVVLAATVSVAGLGSASAAPRTAPAPVRQLLAEAHRPAAKHAAPGERHALSIPGETDDETFLGFNPGCSTGGGKVKPHGFVYSDTKLKLDWVLTGTALRKTGTVKTKVDRAVSLKLPSVRKGDYRLTLALHGKTDLVADESFDVLPCVVVRASCRAVTFTNLAGNPAAYVDYGGTGRTRTSRSSWRRARPARSGRTTPRSTTTPSATTPPPTTPPPTTQTWRPTPSAAAA